MTVAPHSGCQFQVHHILCADEYMCCSEPIVNIEITLAGSVTKFVGPWPVFRASTATMLLSTIALHLRTGSARTILFEQTSWLSKYENLCSSRKPHENGKLIDSLTSHKFIEVRRGRQCAENNSLLHTCGHDIARQVTNRVSRERIFQEIYLVYVSSC